MRQYETDKTISQLVREYIQTQLFIREALSKGIVNYTKLAELIAKEYNLDSIAAIKMALLRLVKTEEVSDESDTVRAVLRQAKVTIKGDVSIIVLYPSQTAFERLREIEKLVTISVGETLYIIREQTVIVIIIEKEKKEKALEILKGIDLIRVKENATALVIISPPVIVSTFGVLSYIVNHFSANKINIEEIISCYRDTIIIVDEHDSTRAYQIVKNLTT